LKEPDGGVSFNQSDFSENRGDVMNITVDYEDTENATLSLGDYGDDGYQFNVSLIDDDEDGQVTLQWNTILIDGGNETSLSNTPELSVADSDDEITVIDRASDVAGNTDGSADSDIIQSGTYALSVQVGADNAAEPSDDVATATVEERSTDALNIWTVPGGIEGDLGDKEDDYDRVGININQDTSISSDDLVIHKIQASGL